MNPQNQPHDSRQERPDAHFDRPTSDHGTGALPSQSPAPQAHHAQAAVAPAAPNPNNEQHFFRPESETAPTVPEYSDFDQPQPADLRMQHSGEGVTWTASEFIAHHKEPGWYLIFVAVWSAIAGGIFLITRDWFNTIVVIIAGVLFAVVASRQPRQMQYAVDDHGITIGRRTYPYSDFRSFSVLEEGAFRSMTFMPLKRFMPPLSIYYDPADEDRIADVLTAHLALEDHKHDPIDRLMRRIRF